MRRAALKHVVQDAQDLLVVGVASLGGGELEEVHHLVQPDEQALVARRPDELRHQLEVVVDVRVVHDPTHPERAAGVGAGGELAAQPAQAGRLQVLVPGLVGLPVAAHHLGELEPARQLLEMPEPLADHGPGGHAPPIGVARGLADEALDHAGQRAPVGLGASREVARHLGVEAARLPSGCMEPPVGREVGEHDHEPLLERDQADEVHEEGLARAVLADREADRGPAVGDALDVAHHLLDLAGATHLDVAQAQLGHDPGTQRLDDGVPLTRFQCGHGSPPRPSRGADARRPPARRRSRRTRRAGPRRGRRRPTR